MSSKANLAPEGESGAGKQPPHTRCANCGREARKDENADDEWRAGSDGVDELHVFCPECWDREFGLHADA